MEKLVGDMYLAAALIAYGADLCRIDKTDPKRQKFCFTQGSVQQIYIMLGGRLTTLVESPTLEEIETRYIARTLLFPSSYPDALRSIKAAIHSE
jgi:hypothetical protein